MVNLALCRFQKPLGPFAMFVVESTSKTRFYRHLSNHLFRRRFFGKYIGYEGHFFWKCSKCNLHFKSAEKNWEKVFSFWDNSIWIGCFKLSLYRRQYLSSSVNMLTNSPKILHSTNIDFSQQNCLHINQQIL